MSSRSPARVGFDLDFDLGFLVTIVNRYYCYYKAEEDTCAWKLSCEEQIIRR